MGKRKTHEEFIDEVTTINPHLEFIGEYINGNSKIKCKCKKCGYEWTSTARNLIKPKKCLNCMKSEEKINIDYSDEEFKSIIKNKYPDLIITGAYKTGQNLITCKCIKDGHIARVRCQKLLKGTYRCPICINGKEKVEVGINDLGTVNPVIAECLENKEDAYNYKANSRAKVNFICPSCGNVIRNKTIEKVHRRGLKCKCSDGNSLGEKYFYQVISQLSDNVVSEYYLNDNYNFRYDFYGIQNSKSWIVEIQGKQHNEKSFETCGGRSLREEIENDKNKKDYALNNNIDYYIYINSKNSGYLELKNEILSSCLIELFDFSTVDWIDAYRKSLTSDAKDISDLWNQGYRVMQICDILRISKAKVRNCLTKANEVGLCKYDNRKNNRIKVKCDNTGEIFNSMREAELKYNIHRGYISGYLKGNNVASGNLPSGEKLMWSYYDELDKKSSSFSM